MDNLKEIISKDLIWIRIKKHIYILLLCITILVFLLGLLVFLNFKIYFKISKPLPLV
jgi:hypothetical protein